MSLVKIDKLPVWKTEAMTLLKIYKLPVWKTEKHESCEN
jgi:hypothetical protein